MRQTKIKEGGRWRQSQELAAGLAGLSGVGGVWALCDFPEGLQAFFRSEQT